jgi:hypothetical protein
MTAAFEPIDEPFRQGFDVEVSAPHHRPSSHRADIAAAGASCLLVNAVLVACRRLQTLEIQKTQDLVGHVGKIISDVN